MSFFDSLEKFASDLLKKLKPKEVLKLRSCRRCTFFKNWYCTQVQPPSKILSEYYAQGCIYYTPEQVTTGAMTQTERQSALSLLDRIKLIDQVSLIDLITEITTIKTLQTLSEITNIKNLESVDLVDNITSIASIGTISQINEIKKIDVYNPSSSSGLVTLTNVPPQGTKHDAAVFGKGELLIALFHVTSNGARDNLCPRILTDGNQVMPLQLTFAQWYNSYINEYGDKLKISKWDTSLYQYTIMVTLPLKFTTSLQLGYYNSSTTSGYTGYIAYTYDLQI